jgi:hypothetical protein
MLPWSGVRRTDRGLLAFEAIPPFLRPLIRAYLLGYASAVAPRLLTLLLQWFSRGKKASANARQQQTPLVNSVRNVLRSGFDWQRFPTFCAVLVGGSALLEVCTSLSCQVRPSTPSSLFPLSDPIVLKDPFRKLFDRVAKNLSPVTRTR